MSVGNTGNRCEIYEKIDALDEARSVSDLVKRLKPILGELAYYAVTGEGAVMDTREEWHNSYTNALYSEAASDHSANQAQPSATRGTGSAHAPTNRGSGSAHAPINRGSGSARAPTHQGSGSARAPSNGWASLPSRPHPRDLPPSLRAIMNGPARR